MVGEIEPDALRERLDGEDPPLLVDIRASDDFAKGHLPGSKNVPLAEIPGSIDEIAAADEVVTICPHGLASVKAGRIVEAYKDFDGTVESLAGGLEAWDGPIERASAPPDDEGAEAPF